MAIIGWGKPIIKIGKLGANGAAPTSWIDIPTPVEDSTQLTTTQGDKLEAPLEGGANKDVKFKRNKYSFEFELYVGKDDTKPVADIDGVVADEYMIKLQPEDANVPGIVIKRASLNCQPSFATSIGTKWKYTAESMVPADDTEQVSFEVVSFT